MDKNEFIKSIIEKKDFTSLNEKESKIYVKYLSFIANEAVEIIKNKDEDFLREYKIIAELSLLNKIKTRVKNDEKYKIIDILFKTAGKIDSERFEEIKMDIIKLSSERIVQELKDIKVLTYNNNKSEIKEKAKKIYDKNLNIIFSDLFESEKLHFIKNRYILDHLFEFNFNVFNFKIESALLIVNKNNSNMALNLSRNPETSFLNFIHNIREPNMSEIYENKKLNEIELFDKIHMWKKEKIKNMTKIIKDDYDKEYVFNCLNQNKNIEDLFNIENLLKKRMEKEEQILKIIFLTCIGYALESCTTKDEKELLELNISL